MRIFSCGLQRFNNARRSYAFRFRSRPNMKQSRHGKKNCGRNRQTNLDVVRIAVVLHRLDSPDTIPNRQSQPNTNNSNQCSCPKQTHMRDEAKYRLTRIVTSPACPCRNTEHRYAAKAFVIYNSRQTKREITKTSNKRTCVGTAHRLIDERHADFGWIQLEPKQH